MAVNEVDGTFHVHVHVSSGVQVRYALPMKWLSSGAEKCVAATWPKLKNNTALQVKSSQGLFSISYNFGNCAFRRCLCLNEIYTKYLMEPDGPTNAWHLRGRHARDSRRTHSCFTRSPTAAYGSTSVLANLRAATLALKSRSSSS